MVAYYFSLYRLSPGIDALVKKLKDKNKIVYLVSGGFRQMINVSCLFWNWCIGFASVLRTGYPSIAVIELVLGICLKKLFEKRKNDIKKNSYQIIHVKFIHISEWGFAYSEQRNRVDQSL